ncbi:hypothetical protein GGR55DRAFT_332211 [Xylaria sp. FL0064]|nr:hypothetical protein GGR55DRAFT_332211 [Xylaria sp. FL0064]
MVTSTLECCHAVGSKGEKRLAHDKLTVSGADLLGLNIQQAERWRGWREGGQRGGIWTGVRQGQRSSARYLAPTISEALHQPCFTILSLAGGPQDCTRVFIGPAGGAAGSMMHLHSTILIPTGHGCKSCLATTLQTSASVQSSAEECLHGWKVQGPIFVGDWSTVVISQSRPLSDLPSSSEKKPYPVPGNVCKFDTFLASEERKRCLIRQKTRLLEITLGKLAFCLHVRLVQYLPRSRDVPLLISIQK